MTHRRGAFTLIELTLAMAMTAMLALTMYKAIAIVVHARRTAESIVTPTRSASIASDILLHDLQSVLPPKGILAGPFEGTHQSGAGGVRMDSLEFYAVGQESTRDDSPTNEGIHRIDLLVRTDVNPPVLVRQVTKNLLSQAQPAPEEEVLCRGVRSFQVQYFDGTEWVDDWDSTTVSNTLPTAVGITLQLDRPDQTDPNSTPITITRIVPMPCGAPLDQTATGGSS